MSVPSGLTKRQKKIMDKAINYPLYKKGDIIDRGKYLLLEDSVAHGCPLVREIETVREFHMTMNGHMQVFKELCDDAGICHCTD